MKSVYVLKITEQLERRNHEQTEMFGSNSSLFL